MQRKEWNYQTWTAELSILLLARKTREHVQAEQLGNMSATDCKMREERVQRHRRKHRAALSSSADDSIKDLAANSRDLDLLQNKAVGSCSMSGMGGLKILRQNTGPVCAWLNKTSAYKAKEISEQQKHYRYRLVVQTCALQAQNRSCVEWCLLIFGIAKSFGRSVFFI